jgi:PhnB protein
MKIEPYLFFNGNCKEAFEFYASALGGKIVAMLPHAGTPAETAVPADWREKIMYARLELEGQALLASDVPPQNSSRMQGFHISLSVKTAEEAERVFAALSEGAKISMPIGETFWSARFGMLTDRFGTPWMVNCEMQQGS